MRPAIEFSAKHNIKPHLTQYKLEELPKMIELMVSYMSMLSLIIHRLTRSRIPTRQQDAWVWYSTESVDKYSLWVCHI